MGRFATHLRRVTTDDSEARGELSSQLRAALPPRFEAVGEALASGSGVVATCEVAGARLARDGLALDEVLDAFATTARLVLGEAPDFESTRALTVAWSDAVLGYLHGLSCDDPLTGLASLAHLRSRVSEVYRGQRRAERTAPESHAFVVVSEPTLLGPRGGEALSGAMRTARLGETARTVFAGSETIGHVAPGRVVVLAGRDDQIGRRVGLLRRLLDDGPVRPRVWIEGLPGSDEAAGRLLDELARV